MDTSVTGAARPPIVQEAKEQPQRTEGSNTRHDARSSGQGPDGFLRLRGGKPGGFRIICQGLSKRIVLGFRGSELLAEAC